MREGDEPVARCFFPFPSNTPMLIILQVIFHHLGRLQHVLCQPILQFGNLINCGRKLCAKFYKQIDAFHNLNFQRIFQQRVPPPSRPVIVADLPEMCFEQYTNIVSCVDDLPDRRLARARTCQQPSIIPIPIAIVVIIIIIVVVLH